MKKFFKIILICTLFSLILSGCSAGDEESPMEKVQNWVNEKVNIPYSSIAVLPISKLPFVGEFTSAFGCVMPFALLGYVWSIVALFLKRNQDFDAYIRKGGKWFVLISISGTTIALLQTIEKIGTLTFRAGTGNTISALLLTDPSVVVQDFTQAISTTVATLLLHMGAQVILVLAIPFCLMASLWMRSLKPLMLLGLGVSSWALFGLAWYFLHLILQGLSSLGLWLIIADLILPGTIAVKIFVICTWLLHGLSLLPLILGVFLMRGEHDDEESSSTSTSTTSGGNGTTPNRVGNAAQAAVNLGLIGGLFAWLHSQQSTIIPDRPGLPTGTPWAQPGPTGYPSAPNAPGGGLPWSGPRTPSGYGAPPNAPGLESPAQAARRQAAQAQQAQRGRPALPAPDPNSSTKSKVVHQGQTGPRVADTAVRRGQRRSVDYNTQTASSATHRGQATVDHNTTVNSSATRRDKARIDHESQLTGTATHRQQSTTNVDHAHVSADQMRLYEGPTDSHDGQPLQRFCTACGSQVIYDQTPQGDWLIGCAATDMHNPNEVGSYHPKTGVYAPKGRPERWRVTQTTLTDTNLFRSGETLSGKPKADGLLIEYEGPGHKLVRETIPWSKLEKA